MERKKGQHLKAEERGAIQSLKSEGYSNRAIARKLNCSPTTVGNELKRGTPVYESDDNKVPEYSAKLGEAVYRNNRGRSHRQHKTEKCSRFIKWVITQIREHKWSFDACVGYAKLHGLFSEDDMVCTKTLYNEVWNGSLSLNVMELPEAIKRKPHSNNGIRKNKRIYGKSIDSRPEVVLQRTEIGHWEADTVIGKKSGKEAVVFSLLEKKTEHYLAFLIPDKTNESVIAAMKMLREEYGDRFAQVFKTITVDNGAEFSGFAKCEEWGTNVYFAHPYSSWERPQNERHNGLFRAYVPKGTSMANLSADYILSSSDELNGRPRKKLGYHTPEELFEAFLDEVYTV